MPIKHKDERKRVYKDATLGDQENLQQLYKDISNKRKVMMMMIFSYVWNGNWGFWN
jgi:hypothetical protein